MGRQPSYLITEGGSGQVPGSGQFTLLKPLSLLILTGSRDSPHPHFTDGHAVCPGTVPQPPGAAQIGEPRQSDGSSLPCSEIPEIINLEAWGTPSRPCLVKLTLPRRHRLGTSPQHVDLWGHLSKSQESGSSVHTFL